MDMANEKSRQLRQRLEWEISGYEAAGRYRGRVRPVTRFNGVVHRRQIGLGWHLSLICLQPVPSLTSL
jgi:hypothetical protein